jgi:exonuclease VII large subunit
MKETNFECILCNKHRNPIELNGLIEQAINEVKKDKGYREIKRELKSAESEFTQSKKVMKQAVQEFIDLHRDEWQAHTHRKNVLSIDAKLTRYVKKFVLAKPMLAGAIMPKLYRYGTNALVGIRMWQYRRNSIYFKY